MQKSGETKTGPADGACGRREEEISGGLSVDREMLKRIAAVLKRNEISVFEFDQKTGRAVFYDESLETGVEVQDFLNQIERDQRICADDVWKVRAFCQGSLRGPIEIRMRGADGSLRRKMLDAAPPLDSGTGRAGWSEPSGMLQWKKAGKKF